MGRVIASSLVLVLAALLASVPGAAAAHDRVEAAILAAVRARAGHEATVELTRVHGALGADDALSAVPDPGARTGQPVRFTLRAGGRHVGEAVGIVRVHAPHVRARRPIARDAEIGADDIEVVDDDIAGVRLERLPSPAETTGRRARRALAAGEPITYAVVIVPDSVRAGDDVRAVIRTGAIEVSGPARAVAGGRVGDVIRVTRAGASRPYRARIVAPGLVEVVP